MHLTYLSTLLFTSSFVLADFHLIGTILRDSSGNPKADTALFTVSSANDNQPEKVFRAQNNKGLFNDFANNVFDNNDGLGLLNTLQSTAVPFVDGNLCGLSQAKIFPNNGDGTYGMSA